MATRTEGFNPVGFIGSQVVGRGVGAATNHLPFLPSFYNSHYTNPAEAFRNSQAMDVIRNKPGARRHFIAQRVGSILGGGLVGGATGGNPLGGLAGARAGSYLLDHLGNLVFTGHWNEHTPEGTVNVGDINTTGDGPNSYQPVINQETGQISYMPTFSNYGPYSSGYKGLDENAQSAGYDVPNYDSSSDAPDYEGPYNSEHYGLSGPSGFDMRSSGSIMPTGMNTLGFSAAGGGFGGGVWQGGGGMRSIQVNSGSLNASNYGGIGGGGGQAYGPYSRPNEQQE